MCIRDRYSNCSESCYILAFIYIDRLLQNNPNFMLTKKSVHRLVLTSMVLAIKYLDDLYYNNSVYATIGGISLDEINRLERHMMGLLHYKLHIGEEMFLQYVAGMRAQYERMVEEKERLAESFKELSKSFSEATSMSEVATLPSD
eukprot:TRINITY_DN1608_c0_g1_i15.p1 TRINITY_DN1608_c0_g1~~TRINITY_DN1608_c0_g1_i15.p1  ORF type:complete len:160 (-),score=25.34 TRINITY_DN1608_c0_g1_i15:64-498(-)